MRWRRSEKATWHKPPQPRLPWIIFMSDGLIGAASIFTRTSDPPIAASAWFFSLSTKPKRVVSVTQARQAAFRANHLPKVGQVATVPSSCYCALRNQGSARRER